MWNVAMFNLTSEFHQFSVPNLNPISSYFRAALAPLDVFIISPIVAVVSLWSPL